MKKKYYVCSPYRNEDKMKMAANQLRAQGLCEEIEELVPNCKCYAPHAFLPHLLDDTVEKEREIALEFGLKILDLCDVLVVCGDIVSSGMAKEIAYARKHGKKVLKYKEGELHE